MEAPHVLVERTIADMKANLRAAKDYRNWNTSRIVAALNDLETLLNLVEKNQSVLWPITISDDEVAKIKAKR